MLTVVWDLLSYEVSGAGTSTVIKFTACSRTSSFTARVRPGKVGCVGRDDTFHSYYCAFAQISLNVMAENDLTCAVITYDNPLTRFQLADLYFPFF